MYIIGLRLASDKDEADVKVYKDRQDSCTFSPGMIASFDTELKHGHEEANRQESEHVQESIHTLKETVCHELF